MQDALLQGSAYLPAAGATANSSLINLGNSVTGEWDPDHCQFAVSVPALNGTQAINSTNVTFAVYTCTSTNLNGASLMYTLPPLWSSGTSGIPSSLTQYFRPPVQGVQNYLYVQASASASTAITSTTFNVAALFNKN